MDSPPFLNDIVTVNHFRPSCNRIKVKTHEFAGKIKYKIEGIVPTKSYHLRIIFPHRHCQWCTGEWHHQHHSIQGNKTYDITWDLSSFPGEVKEVSLWMSVVKMNKKHVMLLHMTCYVFNTSFPNCLRGIANVVLTIQIKTEQKTIKCKTKQESVKADIIRTGQNQRTLSSTVHESQLIKGGQHINQSNVHLDVASYNNNKGENGMNGGSEEISALEINYS